MDSQSAIFIHSLIILIDYHKKIILNFNYFMYKKKAQNYINILTSITTICFLLI